MCVIFTMSRHLLYSRGFENDQFNKRFVFIHQMFNENIKEINYSSEKRSVVCQVVCDDVKLGWTSTEKGERKFSEYFMEKFKFYQVISRKTGLIWMLSTNEKVFSKNQYVLVYLPANRLNTFVYPIEHLQESDINFDSHEMTLVEFSKNKGTALLKHYSEQIEVDIDEYGLSVQDIGAEVFFEDGEIIDIVRPVSLDEFYENFRKHGIRSERHDKRVISFTDGALLLQNYNRQRNNKGFYKDSPKNYRLIRHFNHGDIKHDTVLVGYFINDLAFVEVSLESRFDDPEKELKTGDKNCEISVIEKSKFDIFKKNCANFKSLQEKFQENQRTHNLHFKIHKEFKNHSEKIDAAMNSIVQEFNKLVVV